MGGWDVPFEDVLAGLGADGAFAELEGQELDAVLVHVLPEEGADGLPKGVAAAVLGVVGVGLYRGEKGGWVGGWVEMMGGDYGWVGGWTYLEEVVLEGGHGDLEGEQGIQVVDSLVLQPVLPDPVHVAFLFVALCLWGKVGWVGESWDERGGWVGGERGRTYLDGRDQVLGLVVLLEQGFIYPLLAHATVRTAAVVSTPTDAARDHCRAAALLVPLAGGGQVAAVADGCCCFEKGSAAGKRPPGRAEKRRLAGLLLLLRLDLALHTQRRGGEARGGGGGCLVVAAATAAACFFRKDERRQGGRVGRSRWVLYLSHG